MITLKHTMIDQLLTSGFKAYLSERDYLSYTDSSLLSHDEVKSLSPYIAYPMRVYEDQPIFFMIDRETHSAHKDSMAEIALSVCKSFGQILEDLTQKQSKPQVIGEKQVDFTKLKTGQGLTAYVMTAKYKDQARDFTCRFYIPRSSLNLLVKGLSRKEIAHISDGQTLSDILQGLSQSFYRRNINSPVNVLDLFGKMGDQDFQKTLGIMLSGNLMSYDMLWALATRMHNGEERVLNNLSKNQRDEYHASVGRHADSYDIHWMDIALYQIGLGIESLVQEKKIDSPNISRLRATLTEIAAERLGDFFAKKSFEDWLYQANQGNILQSLLSNCHDLLLAKAFVQLSPASFELIEQNISKRKLKYLLEDIEFQRRDATEGDMVKAQYDLVNVIIDTSFSQIPPESLQLEKWIPRFQTSDDFHFAAQFVGPIDFCLASLTLDLPMKRQAVKNLKTPLKYFVSYFLANKIQLSFPFGERRVREAVKHVVKTFYHLDQEDSISLSPLEEKQASVK